MPATSAYTSLEALLLFQYLRTYGISLEAFAKVAQQLKDDPQIKQDASFDASRLNAPQLREFFLRVWKDEALQQDGANGTHAPTTSPRKRKAGSPPLPTIQDAARDSALLPKLIIRLYGRYRQQVVAEIRADEEQYHKVLKEVKDIRKGAWDARLQAQLDSNKAAKLGISNGVKGTGATVAGNNELLQPGRERRINSNTRSPSPNSTSIALPTTIPRPPLQPSSSTSDRKLLSAKSSNDALLSSNARGAISSFENQGPTVNYEALSQPGPSARSAAVDGLTAPSTATQRHGSTKSPTSRAPIIQPGSTATEARQSDATISRSLRTSILDGVPSTTSQKNDTSQRGGLMLPPFQDGNPVPVPTPQPLRPKGPSTPLAPTLMPKIQQSTPIQVRQSAATTPVTSKTQQAPSPLVLSISKMLSNPSLTSTPVSSPGAAKRLADTKWKGTPGAGAPVSPTRPRSRSVSPISETEAPVTTISKAVTRQSKHSAGQSSRASAPSFSRTSRSTRKTRGASVASSALESSARGRTRSLSIMSHASAEPGTKAEPSTPSGPMDIDVPALASTRRATRGKRKRSLTATSELGDPANFEVEKPSPRERTSVFATRNFQRLSNAVMNDIMSHKHASIFSHPVRDRDADGYSSIIRRPTDLKTIKASIGAGARAVNAANIDSEQLPWSEDLVPPKGIVNSSQLEKEVMRVFANAVMFNPGEDDVVRDAREMFESAAESLMNFKNAEQRTESSGVSGLRKRAESEASQAAAAGHEEDSSVAASVGKRRKVV